MLKLRVTKRPLMRRNRRFELCWDLCGNLAIRRSAPSNIITLQTN
jgi:hypothetical protein